MNTLVRRRVSLGDIVLAGAILGAAAALLLTAGLSIDYDTETGRWIISPEETPRTEAFGNYKATGTAKTEA